MGVYVYSFVVAPRWKCDSERPASVRRMDSSDWHPGEIYQQFRGRGEGQEILVKRMFAMYSVLWACNLGKKWPRCRDLRHRRTEKTLWVRKPCTPSGVNSGVASLDCPLRATQLPDLEIRRLCEEGQLDKALGALSRLDQQGTVPAVGTYSTLLKACSQRKALTQAKEVHAHLVKQGLESRGCLGEYVVSTLVKCNSLEDALQVFHRLPHRTVVSWTAVITGYTKAGQGREALRVYGCMQEVGAKPGKFTFVSLLKACGSLANLEDGRRIHADVVKYGFECDLFVGTCLVDMYAKCGSTEDAQPVFDRLLQRDVVSWNAILSGYAQQGQGQKALQLFQEMQEDGVCPDDRTLVSALQACSSLAEAEEVIQVQGQSLRVYSLQLGKAIHVEACRRGCELDLFVGSSLVRMYGKCGSLMDAEDVFETLSQHDVVSWNAMLAGYIQQDSGAEALRLYHQMAEEGISADTRTFVSLLQACSSMAENEGTLLLAGELVRVHALQNGKAIHSEVQRRGFESESFVGNALVSMYGKCGSIRDAHYVFDRLSQRAAVSWNSMLAGHAQQGQEEKALQLYQKMQEEGANPDDRTFVSALQACGSVADKEENASVNGLALKLESLKQGRAMHDEAWRRGYRSDSFVNNALLSMYGKCGSTVDAQYVFDGLAQRSVVSWNAMLAMYAQQGQAEETFEFYSQMREESISPDGRTFVTLIQACGFLAEKEPGTFIEGLLTKVITLQRGKAFHSEALRRGNVLDVFVGNALVSMYGKCGSLVDTQIVFDGFSRKNVVTWNAMSATYAQQGLADRALELYMKMLEEGVSPDVRSFVTLIQAYGLLAEKEEDININGHLIKVNSLQVGKSVHAEAWRRGYISDVFVDSALVSMYGKFGSILDAENVFDGLAIRSGMAWNAMLAGYAQQGQAENALQIYCQMQEKGVQPDDWTFVSSLQACGTLAEEEEHALVNEQWLKAESLKMGKVIHAEALKKGFESDVFVSNTLVSMYGKCCSIVDAFDVFDRLSKRNVVSWIVMLTACTQQRKPEKVLDLYQCLLEEDVSTDDRTFVTVVQACGILAEKEAHTVHDGQLFKFCSLCIGKAVHAEACRRGHSSYLFLGNALITMYGKCGSIIDSERVFDQLLLRDVVSWNAMLATYAQQERDDDALQLFQQMQEEGMSPDETTFILLLQACGNIGAIDICIQIHHNLMAKGKDLNLLLANTLIHVYGRCARMEYAQDVFDALGQPDVVSWNALIAGHARQGNCQTSLQCYEKMRLAGVKPDEVTFLSVISACSHAGLVDRGIKYFDSMTRSHGIAPGIEHYVGLIDLLGRAGHFTLIEELLSKMPMEPNLSLWSCLLGACRKHGNVALGKLAFDRAVQIQPNQGAAYLLMFSMYAHAGMWDCAHRVNELRENVSAWRKPGQSWIKHMQRVHTFGVGDLKHSQQELIYDTIGVLAELSLGLEV